MIPLILIFLLFLLFCIRNKKEHFQDEVSFITLFDYNNYFNSFNTSDFYIRGCTTISECRQKYKENILQFTQKEKNKLISLIKQVNSLTKDYKSFYSVQWKLCKTSKHIEEGLPHTFNDIIFISDNFFTKSMYYQLRTLIHEKLHIFQRLYPEKTQGLYTSYGYEKYEKYDKMNRRFNPDLDKYDYGKNGILFYKKYNKKKPTGLQDSYIQCIDMKTGKKEKSNNCNFDYEHPNEIFAWKYSKQIVDKNITDTTFINYLT